MLCLTAAVHSIAHSDMIGEVDVALVARSEVEAELIEAMLG